METITIEGFIHKVRMYRECIIYKQHNNGLISIGERAELDREIEELEKGIDRAIPFFRNQTCENCVNNRTCTSQRYPHHNCFEILWN